MQHANVDAVAIDSRCKHPFELPMIARPSCNFVFGELLMQTRSIRVPALAVALLAALSSVVAARPLVPPPILNSNGKPVTAIITARFDPSNAVVPFPTNLLLQGTTDLTLNIPVANPANFGDPAVAMNALDGFGTVAPWSTSFSAALNPSSVVGGQTVRMFEVHLTGPGGGVTDVVRELTSPQEFVAVAAGDGTTLAIVPTAPLRQLTSYMVVLLGDGGTGTPFAQRVPSLTDAAGNDVTADQTYFLAKRTSPVCVNGKSTIALLPASLTCALEPLRQLANSQEAAAHSVGIDPGRIVLSWVATTQSTTVEMQALTSLIDAQPNTGGAVVVPTGLDLQHINPALPPVANVYVGTLSVPYYLSVPSQTNPIAPLNTFWHAAPGAYVPPFDAVGLDPTSTNVTFANPFPVPTTTVRVPVLLTVPNANSGHTKPAAGWPIAIYQHGITRNRTDAFAIAGALAAAGFAVIAIDLPLHGLTDPTSPLYRNQLLTGSPAAGLITSERTFDLDIANNTTGAPGPDGEIDSSGGYFINLTSLLTSRDNLRQGVADLLELRSAIPSMSIDGATPAFDGARVAFVGQSLGSIEGISFMSVAQTPNTFVQNAVLSVPGGGVVGLLLGSPTFAPVILKGLAGAGVLPGTPAFSQFVVAAQTVIDSGDPINYAYNTANKNILVHEVVGGSLPLAGDISAANCSTCYAANGTWLPDQVIPNTVAGSPLSGGEPVIAALGLTPITGPVQSATGVRGVVRFVTGTHGSLLDPSTSPQATVEMQTEAASFLATGGNAVQVTNTAVIKH
jgi:pimeloyl-ACP methyl ester carboxylesterase